MKKFKVLIIEDEDSVCLVMSRLITRFNNQIGVDCLKSGNEALQKIKDKSYILIILDVNLGINNISGTEILKKIKELKPEQNVLMTTGYPVTTEQKKIIDADAIGLLEKPFQVEDLTKFINSTIKV